MKLSLQFIRQKLLEADPSLAKKIRLFGNARFHAEQILLLEETLTETDSCIFLFCGPDATWEGHAWEKIQTYAGLVWVNPQCPPPPGCSALWIKSRSNPWSYFNQIEGLVFRFNRWEKKLYEAVSQRKPLETIFCCLNEVISNPWYFADVSFRVEVIKKDSDLEEMSVIWRYMERQRHLPISRIMSLVETGELNRMNNHREAIYFSSTATFNIPFISKTIFSTKGILGHFYLIGVYSTLSACEMEIADFFGDLLSSLLTQDNLYMPTQGRFYDHYFIDLIEGTSPETLSMGDEVLHSISWEPDDILVFFLLTMPAKDSVERSIFHMEIHMLEHGYPCKAFFYNDKIAALFNITRQNTDNFEKELNAIARMFKSMAGYSEPFTGKEELDKLKIYYCQAEAALKYCAQPPMNTVTGYHQIAIKDFCATLSSQLSAQMLLHPGLLKLRKYDKESHADLETTLLEYLTHEQNTTRTAEALFIHRNTLLYRLEKIRDIIGADLTDLDTRIRLLLSYYLNPPS